MKIKTSIGLLVAALATSANAEVNTINGFNVSWTDFNKLRIIKQSTPNFEDYINQKYAEGVISIQNDGTVFISGTLVELLTDLKKINKSESGDTLNAICARTKE